MKIRKSTFTFVIGTLPNQTPAGSIIRDKIFNYGTVCSIAFNNQLYTKEAGFVQGESHLSWTGSSIPDTVNGNIVDVTFESVITIKF